MPTVGMDVHKLLAGQSMLRLVATGLSRQRHAQRVKLPLVFRTHKPVELCKEKGSLNNMLVNAHYIVYLQ